MKKTLRIGDTLTLGEVRGLLADGTVRLWFDTQLCLLEMVGGAPGNYRFRLLLGKSGVVCRILLTVSSQDIPMVIDTLIAKAQREIRENLGVVNTITAAEYSV